VVRRVTLTDVSKAAGVGIATVSRALGDHPDVSAATRERVRAVAAELGFRPSATARALRSGGFRAISAIVPDSGWGWWEPVVHAAFEAASDAGFRLLVHPVAGNEDGVAGVVDSLENVPTEGVIVISVPDQAAVREACDRIRLPGVAIDDSAIEVAFPSVSAANRAGAREVVEHLIAGGRRDIALVTVAEDLATIGWGAGRFVQDRTEGYREALAAAGIPFDERLVAHIEPSPDDSLERCDELEALLRSGRRVDAVFCLFDLAAAPVLRSLRAEGFRVPQDIAVAGFDDERAARLVDPQLTTARQPYPEMGQLAVDLLLRLIDGESLPDDRHELPTELIVRASAP
jgi:LacI family transcriptional regulator